MKIEESIIELSEDISILFKTSMKKYLCFIGLLACCIVVVGLSSCALSKKIAPQEVKEDVAFVKKQIGLLHPNPYFLADSVAFVKRLDCIAPHTKIARLNLCGQLQNAVAMLNDGHTAVNLDNNTRFRAFFWRSKILPLKLEVKDGRLLVLSNVGKHSHIAFGSEIIEINGVDADSIYRKLLERTSGNSIKHKEHIINSGSLSLDLLIKTGYSGNYNVKYKTPNGECREVFLKGISQPKYFGSKSTYLNKDIFDSCSMVERSDFGSIFYSKKDSAVIFKYPKFDSLNDTSLINRVYQLIKSDSVKYFVLDLRDNTGGTTNLYPYLLKLFPPKNKVCYFDRVEVNLASVASAEMKMEKVETIRGNKIGICRDSLLLSTSNICGISKKAFVLCNAGTFSTASAFCAIVQDNKLGVLVGDDTGGRGSDFGNFQAFLLPNSKLILQVSTSRFIRPNGNATFYSIKPDIYCNFKEDFSVKAYN